MIPDFNQSGTIPPYVNSDGPGAASTDLTPFKASAAEFVDRFMTTEARRDLLRRWLEHRAALRGLKIVDGTQWLDGSFVESKVPKDIDVVTYFRRPRKSDNNPIEAVAMGVMLRNHPEIFDRTKVKSRYSLDAFFLDLDGNARTLVDQTRYFCGLFSHQRGTDLWKGMVEVDLTDVTEPAALQAVQGWVPK